MGEYRRYNMHCRLLFLLHLFSLSLYYYEALKTFSEGNRPGFGQGKFLGSLRTIDEDIERLKADVKYLSQQADNTDKRVTNIELNIDEIDKRVNQLPEVPVGTIIAWTLKIDIDGGEYIDKLPDGWVRCDGKPIPNNSIWVGRPTPNLNGEKRFLRGGVDTEVLITEDHMMEDHQHITSVDDPKHGHGYSSSGVSHGAAFGSYTDLYPGPNFESYSSSTGVTVSVNKATGGEIGFETRPKNMNVIYI